VSADNFYKDDGDKILQNWFLYEYSNILFSKIEESPKWSRSKIRVPKWYKALKEKSAIAVAQK
jgi:hypothetical protein